MSQIPFQHREKTYAITLKRARANSKRLRLSLHADGEIALSVPRGASAEDIAFFITKSEAWLHQQLDKRPTRALQLHYQSGEVHFFLGEPLRLRIVKRAPTEIIRDGATLILALADTSPEAVQAKLNAWYRAQALAYLPERVTALLPRTPWVATCPPIRVRKMRRQWGNCARRGHLTFNTHLIKAPPALIDHVIIHELCHLKAFNHGPQFYQLMDNALPDWRERKAALDALSAELLQ